MVVHITFFFVGILLLWAPRRLMRLGRISVGRKRSHRSSEPWRQPDLNHARLSWHEFGKARNYLDLFRGLAGGLAIIGWRHIPSSLAVPPGWKNGALKLLLVQFAILLIGVLIQTVRNERGSVKFYPPVFFLAGLSVSLLGPWPALFAFVLIWAANALLGSAQAFLLVYAIVMGAFGILFKTDTNRIGVAAVLCILPPLISLLAGRPLLVLSRKAVHVSTGS